MRITFDPVKNQRNVGERGLSRKPNATRPNAENPEWTQEDMAAARPASEVLPLLIGAKAAEEILHNDKSALDLKPLQ